MGIAHHLAALAALVICEEDETALVAALQEHDARGHAPIGRRGRKRHGLGVGLLGAHGFIEPLFKLSDRVAGHLAFIEGLRDVFVAQMRYLARYIFHAFRAGRAQKWEWGIGRGEWGMGNGDMALSNPPLPIPYSPLPIPHSLNARLFSNDYRVRPDHG